MTFPMCTARLIILTALVISPCSNVIFVIGFIVSVAESRLRRRSKVSVTDIGA